jgi:hypothetical protein
MHCDWWPSGHYDRNRQQQFGNEIAQPDSRWFGQPNLANRYEPSDARQKYPESQQIHKRPLAPNRDACPEIDEPGGEIHTSHETVYVVQPR